MDIPGAHGLHGADIKHADVSTILSLTEAVYKVTVHAYASPPPLYLSLPLALGVCQQPQIRAQLSSD